MLKNPISRKIVFLDIDGTIYNGYEIPKSAVIAIHKAKENGHLIYINTGRSCGEIPKDILEIGFDGMVASAGAYVECNGTIVYEENIDCQLLDGMYEYFLKEKVPFLAVTNYHAYGTLENLDKQIEYLKLIDTRFEKDTTKTDTDKTLDIFLKRMRSLEDMNQNEGIKKIQFFHSPVSIEKLQNVFGSDFAIIQNTIQWDDYGYGGEIYSKKFTKAHGIRTVLQKYGLQREDSIAFGDAGNDIDMLAFAGTGVAMGNGTQEIKEVANLVTDAVWNDGLYKGFLQIGLL